MLGVPQPQPPPHLEANDVERVGVSEVCPQGDGSDEALSDGSEPGGVKSESSDDDEEESRYRMRSSKPPPPKRRKPEPYQEYTTDVDYED